MTRDTHYVVHDSPQIQRKEVYMDIKLIIFDFDGTIADTRETIIFSKQETMKIMGLRIAGEEECAATIGLSSKAGFEKMYPGLSEKVLDLCVTTYRKIFEEKKETIPPTVFPGVVETLNILKEKGIQRTIATSRNNDSVKQFLTSMEIADYFSYVLGGEDTVLLKPNPEPVIKTLKDLAYKPEQTLVVGDMAYDIKMGRGAGTFTCGVTYGNATKEQLIEAGADCTIDKMTELINILQI